MDRRRYSGLSSVGDDVGLALRKLRLRPGFSLVAIITLALGIGASAAVFSVADGVLLSPLPYPEPQHLVVVRAELPDQGTRPPSAPGEFADVARGATALESIGALWYRPAALTDDASEPEDIEMAFVTSGLLPTLGVTPLLGRYPLPEEDVGGAEPVIVLAEHLWRRRYGGDLDIIGKRIEMDDQLHTVVGVMPAGFRAYLPPDVPAPRRVDAWVPFGGGYEEYNRNFRVFTVVGRLRHGVTLARLDTELEAVAARTRVEFNDYGGTGYALRAERLDRAMAQTARPLLVLLLVAVGLVLLLVCANVANLLLARAAETRRDMMIRAALGATGGRLLGTLVIECSALTSLGAIGGLLLARWVIAALPSFAPAELPRVGEVELDLRVVVFAALVAAASGLVFAVVTGIEVGRGGATLSPSGNGRATHSRASSRMRGTLLIAELAISLTLLIGVGLMVRSFNNLSRVDPGFDPTGVTTFRMSLVDTHFPYAEPRKIADFYRRLGRQAAALPGVEAAGVTTYLPTMTRSMSPYSHETDDGATEWGSTVADRRHVTPGWMEAMGMQLLAGRFFEESDDLDHPNVVIVDDKLAAAAWPGESAIGKRLQVMVFVDARQSQVWAEVVGVVRHLRHDLASEGAEQVFIPHAQSPMRTTVLTIRSSGDAAGLGDAVRAIVHRLDGDQPVGIELPMSEHVAQTQTARNFAFSLLTAFSLIALVLATIGTYGVISYGVAQRTREIGIRMAIGAAPTEVVRQFVAHGATMTVLGIVLGLAGGAAMAHFLRGLLYDVAPTDPATFGILAATMALITLTACWLPARRAARLDPTLALRSE